MRSEGKSALIHFGFAWFLGMATVWVGLTSGLGLALLGLLASGKLAEKLIKARLGLRWWVANGIFIYLLTWLLGWVFAYNLWIV